MMFCFCYVHNSIVAMREHPSFHAKVVSQTFFSEKIQIEKIQGDWSYIFTSDDYGGWIPSNSFVIRQTAYESTYQVSRLAAHVYGLKDIEYGPIQTLPYRSRLQIVDINDSRWVKLTLPNHQEAYIQKGDIISQYTIENKIDLASFSFQFLGLPYTWGGRSSFGYDCSGFVQMLYQCMGISLPRDSYQQAIDQRFETINMQLLKSGDLIFFGNANQQIKHVGMYLEKGSFIHATSRENQPWIRISHLSDFEWSGDPNTHYPYRLARTHKI